MVFRVSLSSFLLLEERRKPSLARATRAVTDMVLVGVEDGVSTDEFKN